MLPDEDKEDDLDLHLNTFNLDPPRIGGFVQTGLHDVRYGFSLGEDFGQVLGAQDVAQGGGC